VITIDNDIEIKENMMGWGLFFHPDLIRDSALGNKIKAYSFFSYEISEALHLSEKEKQLLYDCIIKIQGELTQNIDGYSQALIISNVELLLNYCARYYGRQFITRKPANLEIITRVEKLLKDYFEKEDHRNNRRILRPILLPAVLRPSHLWTLPQFHFQSDRIECRDIVRVNAE
jgi:hypothetical protein